MSGLPDVVQRLADLRRALAELLDALDTPSRSGGSGRVIHGWSRVEEAFERCEAAGTAAQRPAGVDREVLEREMEDVLRLCAIVQHSADREMRDTASLLERVQAARGKLVFDGASGDVGRSVDLAG